MWIVAEYEASSLFSLKPATATTSGGKTLLIPTPFAIKMALVDVICRSAGRDAAESAWAWLGAAPVAIRPAEQVVINNTFIKVLRPRRNPAPAGSSDAGYFMRTIAYREYAQMEGTFQIAIGDVPDEARKPMMQWLASINYLGKRGSFIQLVDLPQLDETLSDDFVLLDGSMPTHIPLDSLMTQVDDVADKVSFQQVDIYSGKRLSLGKDRTLNDVVLPYRVVASSRGYTFYEWSDTP